MLAEKLGYDGTCVNEHHQNAYGTMPDPNVMGSQIVARTSKIPVGIIGNALPLHDNPVRVAESVAMLDVLSEGRIISGFVRGTGMEYHSMRANPAYSRERFWEAHDLILKAWTDDGPFAWKGKHYDIPYVNPWPRPYQQPHPPIWLPGTGSVETITEAAKRRYPFMMVFAPLVVHEAQLRDVPQRRQRGRLRGVTGAARVLRADVRGRDGRDRARRGP